MTSFSPSSLRPLRLCERSFPLARLCRIAAAALVLAIAIAVSGCASSRTPAHDFPFRQVLRDSAGKPIPPPTYMPEVARP